jgi:hypothetical protein
VVALCDLIVDQKITWGDGQEVVVPTTAFGGCFLGITVSEQDNAEGLQAAYDEFASEAKAVFPDYRPLSVSAYGWAATCEAWRLLFPQGAEFTPAYDCPQAARTSNGVDRLLNHLDRLLYAACYGHSMPGSLRLAIRAMALQWNFHPYGKRLREEEPGRISPVHDLNGFVYHPNWLHNLLISSSMGGLRL